MCGSLPDSGTKYQLWECCVKMVLISSYKTNKYIQTRNQLVDQEISANKTTQQLHEESAFTDFSFLMSSPVCSLYIGIPIELRLVSMTFPKELRFVLLIVTEAWVLLRKSNEKMWKTWNLLVILFCFSTVPTLTGTASYKLPLLTSSTAACSIFYIISVQLKNALIDFKAAAVTSLPAGRFLCNAKVRWSRFATHKRWQ